MTVDEAVKITGDIVSRWNEEEGIYEHVRLVDVLHDSNEAVVEQMFDDSVTRIKSRIFTVTLADLHEGTVDEIDASHMPDEIDLLLGDSEDFLDDEDDELTRELLDSYGGDDDIEF